VSNLDTSMSVRRLSCRVTWSMEIAEILWTTGYISVLT
jgi:hypothetical protein